MDRLKDLTPIEINILNTAEEIINENKILKIEALQNKIKKKYNYSQELVSNAIYNLLLKKIIFPKRKLTMQNILSNDKRRKIFDFIVKNPGCHLNEIREKLNMNPKIADWHLTTLNEFNLIYNTKYLKYRVFFPVDFVKGLEEPLLSLKNDNALKIFKCIIKNPGIDLKKLKILTSLSDNVVTYHLERLVQTRIVYLTKNNGESKFTIDNSKFNFLQKYINFSSNADGKVVTEQPPLPTNGNKEDEKVKIVRDYDFFGGGIRFKIVVLNQMHTLMSNIDILISDNIQFTVDGKVKTIDRLAPNESRGVEFFLKPSTCGKSQIYATISYLDGFGKPQTLAIPPKEIWIKCPLVIPEKIDSDKIKKLREGLQKGACSIQSDRLSPVQLFNIALKQIRFLDLHELEYDQSNLHSIFTGKEKIASTNIILETKVIDNSISLDVWSDSLNQSIGILAYIKNLIVQNINYISDKIDFTNNSEIGIADLLEILSRLMILFEYSRLGTINELIVILNELNLRLKSGSQELKFDNQIHTLINYYKTNCNGEEIIREKDLIELQFKIKDWFNQSLGLTKKHLNDIIKNFKERKELVDVFKSHISDIEKDSRILFRKVF